MVARRAVVSTSRSSRILPVTRGREEEDRSTLIFVPGPLLSLRNVYVFLLASAGVRRCTLGASINDIRKIFVFFDSLSLLSVFGTDLDYKIFATSLTTAAFP